MAELKVAIEATFSIYGKLHPCNFFFFGGGEGGEYYVEIQYYVNSLKSVCERYTITTFFLNK